MNVIEPIDIVLDKPRKLLLNFWGLHLAENEINKLRGAKPDDHVALDTIMVDTYNKIMSKTGMLPIDLMLCLVWGGLLHEDPKLKIEKVAALLDQSPLSRGDLSVKVWSAYFTSSKNSLKMSTDADAAPTSADEGEKKTEQSIGSNSGPQGGLH